MNIYFTSLLNVLLYVSHISATTNRNNYVKLCEPGWNRHSTMCYISRYDKVTFSEAESLCAEADARLASIHSEKKNTAIYRSLKYAGSYWIGLTKNQSDLRWTDNRPVNYTYFADNTLNQTSNNNTGCATMTNLGTSKWMWDSCKAKHGLICEKTVYLAKLQPTNYGCIEYEFAHRNSCYMIVSDTLSWEDAQASCQHRSRDATLVVINDWMESSIIRLLLSEMSTSTWIGMKVKEDDSNGTLTSTWITNQDVGYTELKDGDIDASKGECVAINTVSFREWENQDCNNQLSYVCESERHIPRKLTTPKPPSCPSGWTYYMRMECCYKIFTTRTTWQKAEDMCKSYGGHLASWNDRNEQQFTRRLKDYDSVTSAERMWIGFQVIMEGFDWVDGTNMTYVDWYHGQPDSHLGRENCGTVRLFNNKMADHVCDDILPFICKVKHDSIQEVADQMTVKPDVLCYEGQGWLFYNENCYLFVRNRGNAAQSFKESNKQCSLQGGSLASIHSYEENYWIYSKIHRNPRFFWIGGHSFFNSSWNYWLDGTAMNFFNWDKREPNNYQDQEDCMGILTTNAGYWNDFNCGKKSGYICKKPINKTVSYSHPPSIRLIGHCSDGWMLIKNKCVKIFGKEISGRLTWEDARAVCKNISGENTDLLSLHSDIEIASMVLLFDEYLGSVWIGLTYLNEFVWSDQSEIDFIKWAHNEPNGYYIWQSNGKNFLKNKENCVEMYTGLVEYGYFNDAPCSSKKTYACQKSPEPYDSNVTALDQYEKCAPPFEFYLKYRNDCYQIYNLNMTWQQAREYCNRENAELASVMDSRDNNFLWAITNLHRVDQIFLGLNNMQDNNTFIWSDEWPVLHTYWRRSITLNDNDVNNNCVYMDKDTGLWNTIPCNKTQGFACKYHNGTFPKPDAPVVGDCPDSSWRDFKGSHCYYFDVEEKMPWSDANTHCLKKGGHLVSFHSEVESKFVITISTYYKYPFWIGLIRQQNGYGWSDGSPLDFTYWNKGEPNSQDEDCVVQLRNGKWNNLMCRNPRHYICKVRKVPRNPEVTPPTLPTQLQLRNCEKENIPSLSEGAIFGIVGAIVLLSSIIGYIIYHQHGKYFIHKTNNQNHSFDNALYMATTSNAPSQDEVEPTSQEQNFIVDDNLGVRFTNRGAII